MSMSVQGTQPLRLLLLLLAAGVVASCDAVRSPDEIVARAQTLIQDGKPLEARVRLKSLLQRNPDADAARLLLARVLFDLGEVEGAATELSRFSPERIAALGAMPLHVRVLLAQGASARVLGLLDEGKVELPAREALIVRSEALRAEGRGVESLAALRQAATEQPKDAGIAVELGMALADSGNFPAALEVLDQVLNTAQPDADALVERGLLKLRGGQADSAGADFSRALDTALPAWPLARRQRAELLALDAEIAGGNIDEARARLERLQGSGPASVGVVLADARIALFEGRAGEAVDQLQRVRQVVRGNVAVDSLYARALLDNGNESLARDVLESLYKENSRDVGVRNFLAQVLFRQRRIDDVVRLLSDGDWADDTPDAFAAGLLATARASQERYAVAVAKLDARRESPARDTESQLQRAAAELDAGHADQALKILGGATSTAEPQFAYLKMRAMIASTRRADAVKYAAALAELPQTGTGSLIAAADAAMSLGEEEIGAGLIDRAYALAPTNADVLLRRASLAFVRRDLAGARAALLAIPSSAATLERVQLGLAQIARAQKNYSEARQLLAAAAERAPRSVAVALARADNEADAGQLQVAAEIFARLLEVAPADGMAAHAAGRWWLQHRQYPQAVALLRLACEQDAGNAAYWVDMARAQMTSGDTAAARDALRRAGLADPAALPPRLVLARLDLAAGNAVAALEDAKRLAAGFPNQADAWLLYGDAAQASGAPAKAAELFARAYGLQPSRAAAVRGFVARRAAGLAAPTQPLQEWLVAHEDDAAARSVLAQHWMQTGALQLARDEFAQVVARQPGDVVALNNLAWLLTDEFPAKAEEYGRRALAIEPGNAAILDTLGWILVKTGKIPEATQLLAEAVRIDATDSASRYHYAVALSRASRKNEALSIASALLGGKLTTDLRRNTESLLKELQ